jgi:hypothetical protein
MTPDDMPAGPELDRLVAEKVMGWKLPLEYGILYTDGSESWGNSPQYTFEKFHAYHSKGIAKELLQRPDLAGWSPSTQIAHAWEVVQKISRLKWSGMTIDVVVSQYAGAAHCSIEADMPDVKSIGIADASADTAPLAICLAALKAVSNPST